MEGCGASTPAAVSSEYPLRTGCDVWVRWGKSVKKGKLVAVYKELGGVARVQLNRDKAGNESLVETWRVMARTPETKAQMNRRLAAEAKRKLMCNEAEVVEKLVLSRGKDGVTVVEAAERAMIPAGRAWFYLRKMFRRHQWDRIRFRRGYTWRVVYDPEQAINPLYA